MHRPVKLNDNRKRRIPLSVLRVTLLLMFGLSLGTTSVSRASILSDVTVAGDISIDFRSYVEDPDLQAETRDALSMAAADVFVGTQFAVTSERHEGNWAMISVASLDGPGCSVEYIGAGSCGDVILAAHEAGTGWAAALRGTPEFSDLLATAPAWFVASDAKGLLDPLAVGASDSVSAASVIYRFPWAPGDWQYRQGWHEGSALDIGTWGDDKRVLAAADGVIVDRCISPTGHSANVTIVHDDGRTVDYYHLDKSRLGEDIEEGRGVLRGQVLGSLLGGWWDWDDCGEAYNSSDQSAHLHWVLNLNSGESFTADGWTIDYGDNTWRKGTETRGVGSDLTSSNYLLVKQIKPLPT
jgi:hypothetical protein